MSSRVLHCRETSACTDRSVYISMQEECPLTHVSGDSSFACIHQEYVSRWDLKLQCYEQFCDKHGSSVT